MMSSASALTAAQSEIKEAFRMFDEGAKGAHCTLRCVPLCFSLNVAEGSPFPMHIILNWNQAIQLPAAVNSAHSGRTQYNRWHNAPGCLDRVDFKCAFIYLLGVKPNKAEVELMFAHACVQNDLISQSQFLELLLPYVLRRSADECSKEMFDAFDVQRTVTR